MKYDLLSARRSQPMCTKDTVKDLKLDRLFDTEKLDISMYVSSDTEVLKKRQQIFYDVLHISGFRELTEHIVSRLTYITDIVRSQEIIHESERQLFSVKHIEHYTGLIDELTEFGKKNISLMQSPEFTAFFNDIIEIAGSQTYISLKDNTKSMIESLSSVKSISIGFNFNASFSPYESGILSLNDRHIESGSFVDRLMQLNFKSGDNLLAITPLVPSKKLCKPDEYDGMIGIFNSALNKIFKSQLRHLSDDVDKFLRSKTKELSDMLPDWQMIAFVTDLHTQFEKNHLTVCKAEYKNKEDKIYNVVNGYNPILAFRLSGEGKQFQLVKNNITFDKDGMIFILTGPNNGGKSVFLNMTGIIQIMAQIGMLIPADSAEISPVDRIATHYPKYTSLHQMGRLEDECFRIREIFEHSGEYTLLLFDETFSSTDSDEGSALAMEVLHAAAHMGCKGIFSTHFHRMVSMTADIYTECLKSKIDFLTAGINSDEERNYNITRSIPDGKSYAQTIARKYQMDYRQLVSGSKKE